RAIAAALAYRIVDEDAARRVGVEAALAPAPLLGGAGLVVDDYGEAGHLAQVPLYRVELVAVADRDAGRESGAERILLRLVGDDDDLPRALGGNLPCDLGNRQMPVERLPAGHRHGIVVEDLVSDVDAGGLSR